MKEEEESPEKEPIKEDEVSKPITMQEEEAIPDDQPEPTPQQEPIRSPEPTFDQPMEHAEEVPYEAPMGSPELPPKSPEQIPERPIESKEGVTYQEPISNSEQHTDKPMASPERPEKPTRIPQYEEARRSPTYEVPTDRLIEADEESEMRESVDERIPKNGEPALLIETSETVRSLYRESPSGQVSWLEIAQNKPLLGRFRKTGIWCDKTWAFCRLRVNSLFHSNIQLFQAPRTHFYQCLCRSSDCLRSVKNGLSRFDCDRASRRSSNRTKKDKFCLIFCKLRTFFDPSVLSPK